jgi:limonene-1,2-epoxide hydrolase
MKNFLALIVCISAFYACQTSEPKVQDTASNLETTKTVIEQYFSHFNAHNWKAMSNMYASSAEMKDPAYGQKAVSMTQAEIMAKYEGLNKMILDVHDSVIAMYPSGDNVTVEFISSGTAPDSSKFQLPICTIFEIKNGKITRDYTYYDNFDEK